MKFSISKYAFVCFILFVGLVSCDKKEPVRLIHLKGQTMGTFYDIKIKSQESQQENIQRDIDSLLDIIHLVSSTYQAGSFINQINDAQDSICFFVSDKGVNHLMALMDLSARYVTASHGYFDPTVMPLIRYWGYAPDKKRKDKSEQAFQAAKARVGWKKISAKKVGQIYCLIKNHPQVAMDFNAIAKGYGVDMIADWLEKKYSNDYLVNIGGEIRVQGQKDLNHPWRLGVNIPDTNATMQDYYASFEITNSALASSGNYRDYKIENGEYTVHTIDPISGMAKPSNLLSVTILSSRCARADALATACMAMGKEEAEKMLLQEKDVQAILIFKENDQLRHKQIGKLELTLSKEAE